MGKHTWWDKGGRAVKSTGRFIDPTNTSASSGLGNVVANADIFNPDATLGSEFAKDNKYAITLAAVGAATGGLGLLGAGAGGLGGAAIGGAAGVSLDANESAAKDKKDANKKADEVAAETKKEQQQIIGETKEEILSNNKELLAYADEKNLDIRQTLLDATDETAKILLQGLKDAKTAEEDGLTVASGQIIDTLNNIEQMQLTGEVGARDESIKAIGNASKIYQDTLGDSKALFAPWIENGQWASNELRDRSEELTRKFTLDDFKVDPGYDFRLKQGQKAILNYGSSIGITGNTAKDLVEYSQNVASNEYQNAYIRFRDFQDNTEKYLGDISNQGKSAATQYADIMRVTNQSLANLELTKGDTLAGYLRNRGTIKSNAERGRGGVNADLTIARSALDKNASIDNAAINAGKESDYGKIDTNYLQTGINDRKSITGSENALIAGLGGANVNISGEYGRNAANLALSLGDIKANQSIGRANVLNNTLSNILFMKYSGITGGGGGNPVTGTSGANSADLFKADPANFGYVSPY